MSSMFPRVSVRPLICSALLTCSVLTSSGCIAAEESAKQVSQVTGPHSQTYAVINGRSVSRQEYELAFASYIRQKFYHGKVPDADLVSAREDVRTRMVQRIVLLQEAERRGIVPDSKRTEEALVGYEARYSSRPDWAESRVEFLAMMKNQHDEQSLVSQLEDQIRKVPEPNEEEVKAYYEAKPELFTEPVKQRLSVILLRVDPSSPATAWDGTKEEAKAIYNRLLSGADFSEAARMHSGMYAETGGDMGYLHQGMLPEAIQGLVNDYVVGQVNPPVETLEGLAIFRLEERIPPKLRNFPDVEMRARELLVRERQESAWKGLIQKLVGAADIKYSHEASLPVASQK